MKFVFKGQIREVGDISLSSSISDETEGMVIDVNGSEVMFSLDRVQIMEAAGQLFGWVTITIEMPESPTA